VLTQGLGRPDCAMQGTGGAVRAAQTTRSSVTEMTQRCCRGRSRGQKLGEVPGGPGGVEALRGRDSGAAEGRGRSGSAPGGATWRRRLG
jgi:hypothetical protein